jgi:hypothetical protein
MVTSDMQGNIAGLNTMIVIRRTNTKKNKQKSADAKNSKTGDDEEFNKKQKNPQYNDNDNGQ